MSIEQVYTIHKAEKIIKRPVWMLEGQDGENTEFTSRTKVIWGFFRQHQTDEYLIILPDKSHILLEKEDDGWTITSITPTGNRVGFSQYTSLTRAMNALARGAYFIHARGFTITLPKGERGKVETVKRMPLRKAKRADRAGKMEINITLDDFQAGFCNLNNCPIWAECQGLDIENCQYWEEYKNKHGG